MGQDVTNFFNTIQTVCVQSHGNSRALSDSNSLNDIHSLIITFIVFKFNSWPFPPTHSHDHTHSYATTPHRTCTPHGYILGDGFLWEFRILVIFTVLRLRLTMLWHYMGISHKDNCQPFQQTSHVCHMFDTCTTNVHSSTQYNNGDCPIRDQYKHIQQYMRSASLAQWTLVSKHHHGQTTW
jgi:hypothetical protein